MYNEEKKQVFFNTAGELKDVYAESQKSLMRAKNENSLSGGKELRFIDAIKEGLHQSMHKYPSLILMGQDIAEYGGAFKITEGFLNEFGKERVRDTPLCESAIVGAALGSKP